MKYIIIYILALYGCKSPVNAKSKDVLSATKVLDAMYRHIYEQYKVYIGKAQYDKYYPMLVKGYESEYRKIGSILLVNRNSVVV